MKKSITCFLTVSMLLLGSLYASASVSTIEKDEPTVNSGECCVWMDDFTADPGDVIDAVIWYKAPEGFTTFNFGFTYDADRLDIVTHDYDGEQVEIENAGNDWYLTNGKPTKPSAWTFPAAMLDNQMRLHCTNSEVAALEVPYHYTWGVVDNANNWGASADKLEFVKVSFKVKDGTRGSAYVRPLFYAAAPTHLDASVGKFLPYTVIADDSYASKININSEGALVTYALGDHAASGQVAPAEVLCTAAEPSVTLPAAPNAAKGYKFIGWDVGVEAYAMPGETFTPVEDTTVTAQWAELAKYNITYANGGHGTLSRTSEVITEGNKVKLPAALAEVGYNFLGWSDGTNTYAPLAEVAVSSDMTFTAAWKAFEYNVTFALGDHAAEGVVAPEAVVYEYGTPALILPEAPAAEEGYEFAGWSDGVTIFAAGAPFTPSAATKFTAIWKEEGVALITPKAVYNEYNDSYAVELYFSGVKADNVAFGFDYDKTQLQFVSFAPAAGLDTFNVGDSPVFEVNTEGHYENAVLVDQEGIVAGKCIDAESESVLLGTITFKYISAAEFKTEDSATRFYGATVEAKQYVSNGTNYVYIPAGTGLAVIEKPVTIDPVEETISDVPVFTITGILGVARESGAAKAPAYATIINADGSLYADDVLLETEDAVSEGGDVKYTLEVAAGSYQIFIKKNGYLVSDFVDFEAVENGTIERIDLVPGDVKNRVDAKTGDGKIDLADFVRVVRGFDVDNALTDDEVLCVDINEDGVVTIADLAFVKANYGATAAIG